MLTCMVGKTEIDTFSFKDEQLRKWSNKNMLRCPVCGEQMIYCHGDYKIPYFKHIKNANCPDIYSEGITEEHILGIKLLYDWLQFQDVENIQLEKWMPETRQRPDIYFEKDNKKYCIEFQCSPIATKYNERHDLYRLNKINDIWILGMNKYNLENKLALEKDIYKDVSFEKKLKSIEVELLHNNYNLSYLDSYNGRLYMTNNDLTKNAKRYNSYSKGKDTILKTTFNFRSKSSYLKSNSLDNLNKSQDFVKYDNYYEIKLKEEIDNIVNAINKNGNFEVISCKTNNCGMYYIRYKDLIFNEKYCIKYSTNSFKLYNFKPYERNEYTLENLKEYHIQGNKLIESQDVNIKFRNLINSSISNKKREYLKPIIDDFQNKIKQISPELKVEYFNCDINIKYKDILIYQIEAYKKEIIDIYKMMLKFINKSKTFIKNKNLLDIFININNDYIKCIKPIKNDGFSGKILYNKKLIEYRFEIGYENNSIKFDIKNKLLFINKNEYKIEQLKILNSVLRENISNIIREIRYGKEDV